MLFNKMAALITPALNGVIRFSVTGRNKYFYKSFTVLSRFIGVSL